MFVFFQLTGSTSKTLLFFSPIWFLIGLWWCLPPNNNRKTYYPQTVGGEIQIFFFQNSGSEQGDERMCVCIWVSVCVCVTNLLKKQSRSQLPTSSGSWIQYSPYFSMNKKKSWNHRTKESKKKKKWNLKKARIDHIVKNTHNYFSVANHRWRWLVKKKVDLNNSTNADGRQRMNDSV